MQNVGRETCRVLEIDRWIEETSCSIRFTIIVSLGQWETLTRLGCVGSKSNQRDTEIEWLNSITIEREWSIDTINLVIGEWDQ